mmetsp:Transcript_17116/g.17788  ORF Transcript_17116/g.17788 Transcript_17116/m.17788 type:complete len:285 (+) Transcript_17116:21-875(+)
MVESNIAQQILKELNLARQKPKEMAEKLMGYEKYFKGDIMRIPGQTAIKTTEGFAAFKQAADHLNQAESLGPLIFNTYLSKIAEEAFSIIEKSGDADAANNINLDELISKHGQIAGQFSQAVDFGSSTPELVAVNLLVDDGDQNRGNRSNILNGKFSIIGIASGKHTTFHHCTVITYARHFIPTGEDPGNLSDDCYEKTEKKDPKSTDKEVVYKSVPDKSGDKQSPKYVYVEKKGEDFDLPDGVERVERQEKIIIEDGVKRKLVKDIKTMKDGSVVTDIYKTDA